MAKSERSQEIKKLTKLAAAVNVVGAETDLLREFAEQCIMHPEEPAVTLFGEVFGMAITTRIANLIAEKPF